MDSRPKPRNVMEGRLGKRPGGATDFTNRNLKLRIFTLLAALMFVLAIAERSRDPKFWKWLWEIDQWNQEETVKNRLPPPQLRTEQDPVGTFVATQTSHQEDPVLSAEDSGQLDPVARAWDQGWKDVYGRLEADQRLLLFELLHAGIAHQTLPAEKVEAASNLLATTTTLWEDYQATAFQSVITLPPADQTIWVDVLRQVNRRWSEDARPALQAVLDGRPLTEQEEKSLAQFQATCDALALRRIEDDTIFLRPAEREIWLRLEGKAQSIPVADLRKQSAGNVSYLQLFKQPDEYRGKAVTLRGTVMRAYRSAAPANYLGIKEHVVYWIMPEGGPSSPIVVYGLGTPAEFPSIENRDTGMTKLHEDVVVTGFFLKRGAYLGKDGTYTAPLVIANTPQWIRRPAGLDDASRFQAFPPWLWPVLGSALVVAVLALGLLYWRMRSGEREARDVLTQGAAAGASALSELHLRPSTSEVLKQMADDQEPRSS